MEIFRSIPPVISYEAKPFFLSEQIPFPDNDVHANGNAVLRQELMQNWEKASEDFRKMYESETWGKPIRDALGDRIDSHQVTLEDVGELVGIKSSNLLRKVRAALQVGELISRPNEGIWKFTADETVQYMIGLLARKYRYNYTGVFHNQDKINPDFHETI